MSLSDPLRPVDTAKYKRQLFDVELSLDMATAVRLPAIESSLPNFLKVTMPPTSGKPTKSTKDSNLRHRQHLPAATKREVLLEAGYTCANPRCRLPLLHIHHILHVEHGGPDSAGNLIPLCPNCHAMVHTGTIPDESVRAWKVMLVAANHAWTRETANALLFLDTPFAENLFLTGDGVVRFADLLVSGLAEAVYRDFVGDGPTFFVPLEGVKFSMPASELTKTAYNVKLTQKGKALVTAWKEGNLDQLSSALGDVSGDETEATGNK
ncbi:TPA: HNH endonuclease [Burkholderia vietnamiensis]|nr:HNH endonuclease [Burkholderia vietnamiensis]HDR8936184.1 HNH endonuclease [Burkholderia vietnamiensis]HDR8986382.1 HNH endonuclease [Burkholderia vietnamiensis]